MISVIVCTYNREKYIGGLLESIAKNDLPPSEYEIVLVDNNCTDNTREICEAFMKQHEKLSFLYVVETQQGLSAARNRGIAEAKGDIVLYVDDDAWVDENYLRSYACFFSSHPKVAAAGGPILPQYETAEPDWMSPYTKALLTAYMYYGERVRRYPYGRFPGGGNAAYRKEVFEKVGLFNTALGRKGTGLLGAEEKDIFDKMRRQGMQVWYVPTAVLHHIIPQSKLEMNYFDNLTLQIGRSERKRTKAIGTWKYAQRLVQEAVKWMGTIVLWCGYCLQRSPKKGKMLIRFRKNVTRGLLNES